jgi:methyl-accepting chemotaxis protein
MAVSDKRELILDFLARDKTGDASKKAAKNIGDVGDAADKADRKLDGFSTSSKKAEDAADDLGDEAKETARSLEKLDAQIKLAEHELKGLAKAFADTDDAAERLDIAKVQRKLQSDIRNLSKNKALLTPEDILPPPDDKTVKPYSDRLIRRLGAGLKDAAPSLKGAGIASVGAFLAPEVAGLMAAAVVGGVGLGGLLGGVALAAQDPAIEGWASRIGKRFMTSITAEAKGAFTTPIMNSLGLLEAEAGKAAPKIGKIFDNLAPSLEPLTKDILGAADALLDSFVYASERAAPVLKALGRLAKGVGEDLGSLIEEMADHSDVSADAIDHLTDSIHMITETLGPTIGLLSETYKWLDKIKGAIDGIPVLGEALHAFTVFMAGPIGIFADFAEQTGLFKDKAKDAASATEELTDDQRKLKDEMDQATKAARGQQDALDDLAKQMKAQTDPVFGLLDAQDKLKSSQKNLNDVIKEHGRTSDEAKDAERRLAEAAINLEDKAGALGQTFDGKMTPALRSTLKAAGLTDKQIGDLEKQFVDAKKTGQDFARRYAATASVNGVPGAIKQIKTLQAELKSMKTNWTVTIRQNFLTFGKPYSPAGIASGNVGGLATGGSVREGTPTWVGEHGPELLMMDRPARVLSAAASRGLIQGGGTQAGSFQPQALRLELVGQQEVVSLLRYLIRTANLIQ